MIKVIQKGIDKVLHSAVGLGSIITVLMAYFLILIDLEELIFVVPILLAVGKELIDRLRGGRFDVSEVFATLNPLIVIKWYLNKIK